MKANAFFVNWIDPFIYKLLYPACFGNMIYEIFFNKDSFLDNGQFLIGIAIMFYYIIDFLHLYEDMNKIVKPKDRNVLYHVCDIATPLLFFSAFIYTERGNYAIAMTLLACIPLALILYKFNNIKNWPNTIYLLAFMAITIVMYLTLFGETGTLAFTVISLLIYFVYTIFFYRKYVKANDIVFYETQKTQP